MLAFNADDAIAEIVFARFRYLIYVAPNDLAKPVRKKPTNFWKLTEANRPISLFRWNDAGQPPLPSPAMASATLCFLLARRVDS